MRLFHAIFLGFDVLAAMEACADCDFDDSCFINEGFSKEELDESGLTVICRGGCIFRGGALPVVIPSNSGISSLFERRWWAPQRQCGGQMTSVMMKTRIGLHPMFHCWLTALRCDFWFIRFWTCWRTNQVTQSVGVYVTFVLQILKSTCVYVDKCIVYHIQYFFVKTRCWLVGQRFSLFYTRYR